MPNDANTFLNEAFRTLTGAKQVSFDTCRGAYGWAAETRGVSLDGSDIGYLVSLMKKWGPKDDTRKMSEESNYHQFRPTGRIDSLKIMTQTPSDDKKAEARLTTRLDYLGGKSVETVKERINRAINAQRAAKKLLSEQEKKMEEMLNAPYPLSHYSSNSIFYDGVDFNLIYDDCTNDPSIRLLSSDNDFFARSESIGSLSLILKPIEFQLKGLEKVVSI